MQTDPNEDPALPSDDELYEKFIKGDTSSFDELLIRHGDALILYLNAYLHNLQDSEDLMIESFARIMAKRPSIGKGCFKAYLYKTARNLASRFHFMRSRAETFSLDDYEETLKADVDIEDTITADERSKILNLCLEKIDPNLREALWLVYVEDLSYADAAKVLGVSVKRLDKLLQNGKKVLKSEVIKEGITNPFER